MISHSPHWLSSYVIMCAPLISIHTRTHTHTQTNTQGHLDKTTWQRVAAAEWPLSPPCDNKLELRPQDICINARHKYLCICSCICISPVSLCVSVLTALEQCGDRDLDVKLTALFSAFTARPLGLYTYIYSMYLHTYIIWGTQSVQIVHTCKEMEANQIQN